MTTVIQITGDVAKRNSILTYVIRQLTHDEALVPLPFRLCMANVLISACQKISDSGKKPFTQRIIPHLISSIGVCFDNSSHYDVVHAV